MPDSVSPELLDAFFEDAHDVLEEWERVVLNLAPSDDIKAYEPILRCAHNLKGSAAMTGLAPLQAKVHRFEDYLVQIRDQGLAPTEEVVSALLEVERTLRRWVARLKTDSHAVEDTKVLENQLAQLIKNGFRSSKESAPRNQTTSVDPALRSGKQDESLRVSVAKLDHLIQLVGEISLHQSIVDRATREGTLNSHAIRGIIDLKTKLTQDLQDAALSLRMIPVSGLFQKVERVVFEAAHRLGKQVQVRRKGDDVSLDKLVVDGMLDPLIHIARNAVDHGIEEIVERVQKGKSPHGEIFISAENNAAGVTIHFKDDGKGIDVNKVFAKAVERGLADPNEELSDAAKLNLIFIPGLSTADKLTEYSGRGVGMDVVSEAVKKMGGRIEIKSETGVGTEMLITLPTNLSILDALVIKVKNCQYAIPNQDLTELIDLREHAIQQIKGGEGHAIDLRGQIVPVEDIATFLKQEEVATEPCGERERSPNRPRPGIIVMYRDQPVVLEVEEVTGQQQIFVRPLSGHLAPVGFYGGSTILSDGEPTIILNLPEMARLYFTSH